MFSKQDVFVSGINYQQAMGILISNTQGKIYQLPGIQATGISTSDQRTLLIDPEGEVIVTGKNIDKPNIKALKVSVGHDHALILDTNQEVWLLGKIGFKELSAPWKLPLPKCRDISAGGLHSAVIDISSTVWTFGYNRFGQLGTGDQIDRDTPVQLGFKAKMVVCRGNNTMLINLNNDVIVFGANTFRELSWDEGPVLVPSLIHTGAKFVSLGPDYSVGIALDGSIWVNGIKDRYIWTQPIGEIMGESVACTNEQIIIIDIQRAVWSVPVRGQTFLFPNTRIPGLFGTSVTASNHHFFVRGFVTLERNENLYRICPNIF